MSQSQRQYRSFCFQNLSRKAYFEGWYYKQVSADGMHAISLIPGVSKNVGETNPFIQVIYGERREDGWQVISDWLSFAKDDLKVTDEPFLFRLDVNAFRRDGISLDFFGQELRIRGSLSFYDEVDLPDSLYMPTIMGPFSYLPGMECIHSINSLSHQLTGSLFINEREIDFTGGKGYIEKDWGRSFPKWWVWMQSNHFEQEKVSLMFSVAKIPWLGHHFTGFLSFLKVKEKLYLFSTYTGAQIKKLHYQDGKIEILVVDKHHMLKISGRYEENGILKPQRMA